MMALPVFVGAGEIMTLGAKVDRSPMSLMASCLRSSALNAVMDIGVSWRDCSRFCAVTTISSSACAWDGTGVISSAPAAVSAAEGSMADMIFLLGIMISLLSLYGLRA